MALEIAAVAYPSAAANGVANAMAASDVIKVERDPPVAWNVFDPT